MHKIEWNEIWPNVLNATSKNYFSAIYFTSTSLQLTLETFSIIF